jgi:hypothetical protein
MPNQTKPSWDLRRFAASVALISVPLTAWAVDATAQPPQATPPLRALQSSVVRLQGELAAVRAGESSHSAEYFFNAVTIIIAVAAGIIAVVAIITTVVGYRMVRSYVASEFTARADSAFEEHGKPRIEASLQDSEERLGAKLEEINEKLGAEIELFRQAGGRAS